MKFSDAVEAGYRNYFNFSGTAGRAEYWWFWLWYVILTAVCATFLMSGLMLHHQNAAGSLATLVGLIFVVLLIGTAVPVYAVQVRRLHDVGHSGWWVGALVLLLVIRIALQATLRHSPDPGLHVVYMVLGLVWIGINLVNFVFLVQPSRSGHGYSRY